MARVELLYDRECPNVAAARTCIVKAFAKIGAPPEWTEWEQREPSSPDYVRQYGSPTILVDGEDVVDGATASNPASCRIYSTQEGYEGTPPTKSIVTALLKHRTKNEPATGDHFPNAKAPPPWFATPGIIVALLPKLACPACWPAYAGIMSSLGLSFMWDATYLLPLTVLLLGVTQGALAFRAKNRRGYAPFALGLVGCLAILLGKFMWDSTSVVGAGICVLIGASIWNSWPTKRKEETATCPDCVSSELVKHANRHDLTQPTGESP